jgi:hypothetical protein
MLLADNLRQRERRKPRIATISNQHHQIMDLTDFIPFKNEFAKAYHGLTGNATHTSENPVFDELKVRRYEKPSAEVSEVILANIDRWIGWNLKNERTAVGGMMIIRAEVFSLALLGMKIDITFGLFEEKDVNGRMITTVNSKAETNIESKGDLGESRRVIRMMLGALDFEFRKEIISKEDYLYRAVDPRGSAFASQQLFNETKLQHKKIEGSQKGTKIEFKSKVTKQTIPYKPSAKSIDPFTSTSPTETEGQNGSSAPVSVTVPVPEEIRLSKPKVTIITTKKPI